MLRTVSYSTSPVNKDSLDLFSVALFATPRDLQKDLPYRHNRSIETMCVHMKSRRRVIFPTLHGTNDESSSSLSSPRSTIDLSRSVAKTPKKSIDSSLPEPRMLTLEDIALTHASHVHFKSSHMLPLSPLLTREELTRLGLDLPSRFVSDLPLMPHLGSEAKKRMETPTILQKKIELVETAIEAASSSLFVRGCHSRATTPSTQCGGRRSILPIRVSPLRHLSSSMGSASFHSDTLSHQKESKLDVVKPETKGTKLISILRPSSYGLTYQRVSEVGKVSSVESDIPSLAPSETSEGQSPISERDCFEMCDTSPLVPTTPTQNESISTNVVFNARVLVREFSRSEEEVSATWYTAEEMNAFKVEATKRIMAFTRTEIIPTGTGRMIERAVTPTTTTTTCTKALFSHVALQADCVEIPYPPLEASCSPCPPMPCPNIKNILIVDPYDICLKLYTKAFQQAIPGVLISTCRSSEEALKQVIMKNFDLIIVEERLKLFHRHQQPNVCENTNASGSFLMQRMSEIIKKPSILIGVSAHLPEDSQRLQDVGKADLLWSKPPPPLKRDLLVQLYNLLESKRECRRNKC